LELLPLLSLLSLEPLLSLESLLLESLLLDSGLLELGLLLVGVGLCCLVDDLVGVDGGLDHTLGKVLLSALDVGDGTLAVDDGLYLVDHIGHHCLLHDRLALDDTAHVGGRCLLDVLLDVVDDVLVDFTVDDGLNLDDAVLSDGLLDDGSIDDGLLGGLALAHLSLLHLSLLESLLLDGRLLDGGLLGSDVAGLTGLESLLLVVGLVVLAVVGKLVQKSGHD